MGGSEGDVCFELLWLYSDKHWNCSISRRGAAAADAMSRALERPSGHSEQAATRNKFRSSNVMLGRRSLPIHAISCCRSVEMSAASRHRRAGGAALGGRVQCELPRGQPCGDGSCCTCTCASVDGKSTVRSRVLETAPSELASRFPRNSSQIQR